MGCTDWSGQSTEERSLADRIAKLREELRSVSLGEFTADDFEALLRVMTWKDPNEVHVTQLERRLAEIKKRHETATLNS